MICIENSSKATTLVDLLSYRAIHQPERAAYTFLEDGETQAASLTYRQLERLSQTIAAYLQLFCLPGDRALLIYPPGVEYIAAFFGCLYAGVIAVPAYPPRPNRSLLRLQGIAANASPKVALTTQSVLDLLERRFAQAPELKELKWVATEKIPSELASQWRSPSLKDTTIAFLQYTSGSTAEPRGVIITHANLLHNLELIYRAFSVTQSSSGLSWLPMYHDMGLIGGILQPLYAGVPLLFMSPLMFLQSPIRWLQAISRYRITSSGGPNFAYELCVRKITPEAMAGFDLSSWEIAFNGAEPINYQTLERFIAAFEPFGFRREAFNACYGMAEATLIITGGLKEAPVAAKVVGGEALERNQIVPAHADEKRAQVIVSCGQSLLDQQLLIVDPDRLTRRVESEIGEIWVAGKSVAQGYWNNPEATQHSFNAYLSDTGAGPFLRTGDLGFTLDGELFVTGRLKDIVIINGRNYYPQDIEWTIEQTHAQLRPNSSAVFSVNLTGEERLVVVAEVERSFQLRHQPSAFLDTLVQSMRRAVLQHYDLQVETVRLLKPGSIPKTSSGKIQRYACRAHFLAGTLKTVD